MSGQYTAALKWIVENSGTSGATGLAKMVLSLYNRNCGFAFSECIGGLDANLTAMCVKMCEEYSRMGENDELRQVGEELANNLYYRLWKEGIAMSDTRRSLQEKWEREDRDAELQKRKLEEREENQADQKIIEEHDRLRGTYR